MRWLLGDRLSSVLGLSLSSLLAGVCEAGILAILAQTAAALVIGNGSTRIELGPTTLEPTVGTLLAVAFILSLARIVLGIAQSRLQPQITANVQAKLRRELLAGYMNASWSVQSQDREGLLQETITNQTNQASQAAAAATGLVGSVLAFIVLVATALLLNPLAVLVVMAVAVMLFGVMQPLRTRGRAQSQALSSAQIEFASAIGEINRMAEETHVFGVDDAQRERANRYVDQARDLFIRAQTIVRLVPNLYQGILYLFIVLGLAALYNMEAGQIPSLGAVVLLLIRAGTYGQAIQGGYQIVHQFRPFVDRVRETSSRYAASASPNGTRPMTAVSTISFEHVSFGYRRDIMVLSDINFDVAAGEAIGIAGPSGSGKSSTAQILLQLRKPTSGRYLINGIPADEFVREDWKARVAYVPQEPHLIHATVGDNIRYFRDLDDRQVEEAARLAHIHDDVEAWTDSYETIIGPRADAVSGGQKQRLCLARALAAKPDVLVLDEPTSALDPRSEALVKRSLDGLRHELTLFVVAHGSTLLDSCDRIMVIVDGKLEAFGSTASLTEASSYQRAIAGLTRK